MTIYKGWGRKSSGLRAIYKAKANKSTFLLSEDGFIRSVGLGNSPSFSKVFDDIGIYYDATKPSKLENILNSYDFDKDTDLMNKASLAIELIKKYQISKYNNSPDFSSRFFKDSGSCLLYTSPSPRD